MNITSHLFEAYLKCPTKCFLRSVGETARENEYANWVQAEDEAYRSDRIKRLTEGTAQDERATGAVDPENLKSAKWKFAVDLTISAKHRVFRSEDEHPRFAMMPAVVKPPKHFPKLVAEGYEPMFSALANDFENHVVIVDVFFLVRQKNLWVSSGSGSLPSE